MFEQVVEFSDAYPPGASVHPQEEYRVNSTASNFYRIASAIRVYLPTLNKCEHVVIPSGKLQKQSERLILQCQQLQMLQASSFIVLQW